MKTVSERLRRNANMCARVNAAVVLLCETALVGANEIERLEKQRDELLAALKGLVDDIRGLMDESDGVAGLHLNGDLAPWSELDSGGMFERLTHLTNADDAIAKAEG